MKNGTIIPTILLPRADINPHTWAVIACDQFTSEPEYWDEVKTIVGSAPSTFHITLPEVYLDTPEEPARLASIRATMDEYLSDGVFVEYPGLVLVKRTAEGKTRHGLMVALDLEEYDFTKGSTSLIRATEGTIVERIPPRIRIRSGAPIELPHILVLIDDPAGTVIEPLIAQAEALPKLYDVELMLGSGHVTGYAVDDQAAHERVLAALSSLAEPGTFATKYDVPAGTSPLLYAMGDGNHSLATAKTMWEDMKATVGMDHPARYALVEIENIHDAGLEFEPIFRVLFDVHGDFAAAVTDYFAGKCRVESVDSMAAMTAIVDAQAGNEHAIGVVRPGGYDVVYVSDPPSNLPVGTIQAFLDDWGKNGGFERIDYVHGKDVVERLGSQAGNIGIYLPAIGKDTFFKTVIVDGALPRKTFSMGEAKEKRFYLESRRITESS